MVRAIIARETVGGDTRWAIEARSRRRVDSMECPCLVTPKPEDSTSNDTGVVRRATVNARVHTLATDTNLLVQRLIAVRAIPEFRVFFEEDKLDFTRWPVTVFPNDDFGSAGIFS